MDEFFQNAAHYLEEGLAQAEETREEIQSVDPVVIPTQGPLFFFFKLLFGTDPAAPELQRPEVDYLQVT